MPPSRRVVVTGIGQVSALGRDVPSFWSRVTAGQSGIRKLDDMASPGLSEPIGAAVPNWDANGVVPRRFMATASLTTQYAFGAAAEAFTAAGLEREDRHRGGIVLGTAFAAMSSTEGTYRTIYTKPGSRPGPAVIPTAMANATAGLLSAEFRLKGPNLTVCVACSASAHAIGLAYRLLRSGEADIMLTGGADAPLTAIILSAWNAMRVLAPCGEDAARACRPFSADRQGLVLGEGAGILVLETIEHAEQRGAPVLAELLGYGANSDAGHITHPDLSGVRSCIELAIADAGLETSAIGYVNAHGTATAINDSIETRAIAEVFGPSARQLMVSSTKAVHGHAMGATGALEAVATVQTLVDGVVPPTANLLEADPELPTLDYVRGEARKASVEAALSNSLAFGGSNAVLVFGRFRG